MERQTDLQILARAAARVFVSGPDGPVRIRRAGAIHLGGDTVEVEKDYEDGPLTWVGPLVEWRQALSEALT